MHPDGTEHRWQVIMLLEQGEWMPATTICGACGLTIADLLDDVVLEAVQGGDQVIIDLEQRLEG